MFYCYFCMKDFEADVDLYPDEDDPAICPDCKAPHAWEEACIPILTDDEYQLIAEKRRNDEYAEYLYKWFKKHEKKLA